ncbi:hypothetical protein HMPREF3067_04905 [Corynebacterium sp. HMSC04H06]|nr:hypothetical protein HMPREF3067_04905 [Corynebacterium sp. HMSC04H06]
MEHVTDVVVPARARKPLAWLLGIAAVGGSLFVMDSGFAMHAEHSISQRVKEESKLENSPEVFVGGMPYLGASVTNEIPLIEVKSLDVEVPHLGMINAQTTLRDITVAADQLTSGNFAGASVSTFSRAITLDGVALGRLLSITDLSIANPDNISPTGGMASEAELSGTVAGAKEPTRVRVTLRLVGERFYMRPVEILELAEGTSEEEATKAFELELDTRQLPLPAQATAVRLQGGGITFETQRRNTHLQPGQLAPIEIAGDYDSDGREVNDENSGA